jgi:hypothetical protein
VIRHDFSSSFLGVVFSVRVAFSKRSWPYMASLAIPYLLAGGQRSVCRLAKMARHARSESAFYRFLSDGKWRMMVLFQCLFNLIVGTFGIKDLTIVVDDTLCPKWGRGIFGTGSFFDHTARPKPGFIWGHNWLVLAVVVQVRAAGWVALPFWVVPYRSEDRCPKGQFKTRHEMTVEALKCVRSWFPGAITLIADGAYNNRSILDPTRELGITLVSRMRSDARLRAPDAPPRRKGKRGRKPKHGPWLSKLAVLARESSKFHTTTVAIYGKTVTLRVREIIAYWPAVGRVVKVVITRDPKRPKRVAYLMTSDLTMSAVAVVEMFARRWTIEQLFSVAKNQMGFDSAEVRTERAVRRHAALCLAMVTFVEVWAHRLGKHWSAKPFSAKLAKVRQAAVEQTIFASGPRHKGKDRIANTVSELFVTALKAG